MHVSHEAANFCVFCRSRFFVVENILNIPRDGTSFSPSPYFYHACSNGRGLMLVSVMFADSLRHGIINSLWYGTADSNPLVIIYDRRQTLIDSLLFIICPVTPRLMPMFTRSNKFSHKEIIEPLLVSRAVPLLNKTTP